MASSEHGSPAKAILYAFLANLGIALSKSWAAFFTGSGSMLAEAIHSYADCGNQVLLYIGLRGSERPPNEIHPLGYGKVSYFWSFVVAIMLFSIGGLFSIYEGVHKLDATEPLSQVWVALLVLGFSIVLEAFSLLGCLREIKKLRKEASLRQWLSTTRNAELVVVLGEDVAALGGLVLAFGFVGAAGLTGDPLFDALGSIVIGTMLVVIALFVGARMRTLLVGASAEPAVREAIDRIIADQPDIKRVFNTITIQFGPKAMLAAKIQLRAGLDVTTAVERINELERELKIQIPTIGWCFIEPDVTDDE